MLHLSLKILVWTIVLGVAYLAVGPKVFDSGGDALFSDASPLYLPPAKSDALRELERRAATDRLAADQAADYQTLAQDYQAGFWRGDGTTVEQALSGVATGRAERLAEMLDERGLSQQEAAVFFAVVRRDRPGLLDDRD